MHMHTFNSPASAAAIVVFSNLFRVAWTGNNISVSKGALKFRCASKLCFANFSVKFWLKRWEIVVHGLTNMKNFRVSKTTYYSSDSTGQESHFLLLVAMIDGLM